MLHMRFRHRNGRLHGSTSLRAVLPAAGAHKTGCTLHDVARISLRQLPQRSKAELLKPLQNRRADALDGEQGLAFCGVETHTL